MHSCCFECGKLANYVTCMARYGRPPLKSSFDVSTVSKGKCHYCGRETDITEPRDFFYPDFTLVNWKKYRKEMEKRDAE